MKYPEIDDVNHEEMSDIEYEFLTPKEVMNLLCVGKNTFYRLVNSGELPAFRIGKLWRVKRDVLNHWH